MNLSNGNYDNGDCPFILNCILGEDIGGEGGCDGCVHNLEENRANLFYWIKNKDRINEIIEKEKK